MEQANIKGKSKEKAFLKLLREAMIKEVGTYLDFLVSIDVLNAYKVKRDFGMGDSTFNNLRLCKLTVSFVTLEKMVYVIAYYLGEYQKAVEAEPYGHEKAEKQNGMPAIIDRFKKLYGVRASLALDMSEKGIDLRQVVKHE